MFESGVDLAEPGVGVWWLQQQPRLPSQPAVALGLSIACTVAALLLLFSLGAVGASFFASARQNFTCTPALKPCPLMRMSSLSRFSPEPGQTAQKIAPNIWP